MSEGYAGYDMKFCRLTSVVPFTKKKCLKILRVNGTTFVTKTLRDFPGFTLSLAKNEAVMKKI